MMKFEEARATILDNISLLGTEEVELLDSLGRVAAEDTVAPFNLPPFDNSAMDGYAVRAADCAIGAMLEIHDYVPAGGIAKSALEPGKAIKIMTGAPLPKASDVIVPFEDATEENHAITLNKPVRMGQHIRRAGEDVKSGDTVFTAGTQIRTAEINILASLGAGFVKVYRRPVVAILATGDELIEAGQPLAEGKLYNSNSFMLAAAVREAGGIPLILGIARDNRESLREKMEAGLEADVLITAAGVSVGDRDFVRPMLEELGVKQVFWKIDIKPGKSTAFGMHGRKPVFALPGNPVSAMITFLELVRPAILKMMGRRQVIQPLLTAIMQEDMRNKSGKTFFARVRLEAIGGKLYARSAGHQDTGFQRTVCMANGIAMLPADRNNIKAGEDVAVHFLGGNLNLAEPVAREEEVASGF
jgi:molybdopterin molybdotransferase